LGGNGRIRDSWTWDNPFCLRHDDDERVVPHGDALGAGLWACCRDDSLVGSCLCRPSTRRDPSCRHRYPRRAALGGSFGVAVLAVILDTALRGLGSDPTATASATGVAFVLSLTLPGGRATEMPTANE
jgi:hypothetical protein